MTPLCHSERSEESEAAGAGFLPSVEMTRWDGRNDREVRPE